MASGGRHTQNFRTGGQVRLGQTNSDGQDGSAFNATALDPVGRSTMTLLVKNMCGRRWSSHSQSRQGRDAGNLEEEHGCTMTGVTDRTQLSVLESAVLLFLIDIPGASAGFKESRDSTPVEELSLRR